MKDDRGRVAALARRALLGACMCAAFTSSSASLAAQAPDSVASGARIRVWLYAGEQPWLWGEQSILHGNLVSRSDDAIEIELDNDVTVEVPLRGIERIDSSRGRSAWYAFVRLAPAVTAVAAGTAAFYEMESAGVLVIGAGVVTVSGIISLIFPRERWSRGEL